MSSNPSWIRNPSIARLVQQTMAHVAVGNQVYVVDEVRSGNDPDLGVPGTLTLTQRLLTTEPMLSGMSMNAVVRSGGAFMYSDLRMSCSKDSLTEDEATRPHVRFQVNGEMYEVIARTPNPSTWEFVLRRVTESL